MLTKGGRLSYRETLCIPSMPLWALFSSAVGWFSVLDWFTMGGAHNYYYLVIPSGKVQNSQRGKYITPYLAVRASCIYVAAYIMSELGVVYIVDIVLLQLCMHYIGLNPGRS